MNSISQAISNSISALPAMAPAVQAVPAQGGGFASRLAVAQGLSASSSSSSGSTAGGGRGSSGLLTASTNATTDQGVAVPTAQGPQPKKPLSNGSPATGSVGVNWSVPMPVPTLSVLTIPVPGTTAQNVDAAGDALSELPSSAKTTPQNTLSGFSATVAGSSGAVIASQTTGQRSQAETVTAGPAVAAAAPPTNVLPNNLPGNVVTPNLTTSDICLANIAPAITGPANTDPANEISLNVVTANVATANVATAKNAPPNNDSPDSMQNGGQANGAAALTEANLGSPSTLAGTSMQIPDTLPAELLAAASGGAKPNSLVNLVAPIDRTGAVIQNGIAAQNSAPQIRTAVGSSGGQSIPQASHGLESTASAPTLTANSSYDGKLASDVPPVLAINPQAAVADPASAIKADSGQANFPVPAENGSSSFQIMNPQSPASGLSLAESMAWGTVPLPPAAPAVTAAIMSRAVPAGQSADAPASILPSTLPATANSGNGLATARQTPFSLFFSGPGPGTEAAAATLPRMILPTLGSAPRESHTSFSGPLSASSQNNGVQTNGVQGVITQNATGQNSNGSTPGGEAGSPPPGPPLRHGGDASSANLPIASSQAAAPPIPAATVISTTAPGAMGGQPILGAELPTTTAPPPAAPDRPASAIPLPSEQSGTGLGPVQVAQLVTRVGQSEMRIGMNTSAFGSVEVRTVIHASDVGLTIGSEKGDLRTLLANDMPAITNTLQQQNLRLQSVNFMQGFAFSNNSSGGGDAQQPRSFAPMQPSTNYGLPAARGDDPVETSTAAGFGGEHSSLSILA